MEFDCIIRPDSNPDNMDRSSILFLCTHNSARSQLAEAIMRHHFGDRFDVYSAGTERTFVKPEVPIVLDESGISIEGLTSKTTADLGDPVMDYVVTVCDDAKENCPYQPARKRVIHQAFKDPSSETSSQEARLDAFRKTRDEISQWILGTFAPEMMDQR